MDAAEYKRLSQLAASGMAEAQGRQIDRKRLGRGGGIEETIHGDAPPLTTALIAFLVGTVALFAVQAFAFWQIGPMMDEIAEGPAATSEQIEAARLVQDMGPWIGLAIAAVTVVISMIGGSIAAAVSGLIYCASNNQPMAGIGAFMFAGAGTVLLATAIYEGVGVVTVFNGGILGYAIILSVTCGVMRSLIGLPLKYTGTLIISTFAVWIVVTVFLVAGAAALLVNLAG
ncbi:MAG: hypothetical protein AAF656_01595 [Planctomycetota bacterium]